MKCRIILPLLVAQCYGISMRGAGDDDAAAKTKKQASAELKAIPDLLDAADFAQLSKDTPVEAAPGAAAPVAAEAKPATPPAPAGAAGGQRLVDSKLKERLVVWVHAFARSGSSTLQSMVTQAGQALQKEVPPKGKPQNVFSLFEPCDPRDKLDNELESKGCTGVLESLANCDFKSIRHLEGWKDTHSFTRGAGSYSPNTAGAACKGADVVAFKTVTHAFTDFILEENALPLLDADKRMLLFDIVRDPRSVFSSWMNTWPFNDTNIAGGVSRNVQAMRGVCDSFSASLRVQHPRLFRVVFERLVKDPQGVMDQVCDFMNMPCGERQQEWVRKTFNAKECPGVDKYIAPYSDCHQNAEESLDKWRSLLSQEEKDAFTSYPPCMAIADMFGYPKS